MATRGDSSAHSKRQPEKSIFVQCAPLTEEGNSAGVAMMTTIKHTFPRTEPYWIMTPIDPSYAHLIERVILVIDGKKYESDIDPVTQSHVKPHGRR